MKRGLTTILAACAAILIAGAAQADGDAAAGKVLAKKCVGCHGAKGEGKKKNPPIAGIDQAAFVKSLKDYKTGARKHKMMKFAVKKLKDKDFNNLAAYYATLK
jgi:cytochrome c553